MVFLWARRLVAGAATAFVVACGGGGGGGGGGLTAVPSTPGEAVVANVSDAQVLESGTTAELVFTVTLNKPAESGNRIIWSTASTAKAGGGGTGSATSGTACGAGVDYVAVTQATLLIPRGTQSGEMRVTVCGDAVFEPNETLFVNWTEATTSVTGTVTGTIVNDDAGGLNGTGQAAAFGRDGNVLTNSGIDGKLGFSFNTAAGGCIRDNVTGLLWEPKTAGNLAGTLTYANLAAYVAGVNGANLCGFSDWRLPTPEELGSLVDNGTGTAPTIDTVFTSQAAPYWTSTEYRDGLGANAWFVDFGTGTISLDNKAAAKAVRLVTRGGTTAPAPLPASCVDPTRFTVHGDGTVTDARTGLMWKQCAEGQSGSTCAAGGAATFTWDLAMQRPAATNANAATNLGYSDWRLPNRAELSSIAEREQCFNPAINQAVFPNTGLFDYWTSSPYALNSTLAWRVNFSDGEVAPAAKAAIASSPKLVRLVRAGQ